MASLSLEEKEMVESPRMEDSQEDDSIIELSLPWIKPVTMVIYCTLNPVDQASYHGNLLHSYSYGPSLLPW